MSGLRTLGKVNKDLEVKGQPGYTGKLYLKKVAYMQDVILGVGRNGEQRGTMLSLLLLRTYEGDGGSARPWLGQFTDALIPGVLH